MKVSHKSSLSRARKDLIAASIRDIVTKHKSRSHSSVVAMSFVYREELVD
jgi:hypothetical protein